MSARSDASGRAAERRPPAPLRVREIEKRFGRALAVGGVTLDVERGEVVGLLGANGSGKTTLLLLAAGLLRPDRGAIEVCGARAGSMAARESVALVPDEPAGFDELTVGEHVALLAALYGAGAAAAVRAERLLEAFGLADRRQVAVAALSHGLRRRAALAAALSVGTPLLLVDEATATLDPAAVGALATALRAHADGAGAVLLATQDLVFADAVCDRVVTLAGGTVAGEAWPTGRGARDATRRPDAAATAPVARRPADREKALSRGAGDSDGGARVAAR